MNTIIWSKKFINWKKRQEFTVDDLMEKLIQKKLPSEASSAVKKQLKRLKAMQPATSEYTVARTYIDWMLEVPWSESSVDNLDIQNAKKVFEEDHYGLEKVKKRLIEFLAVRKLNNGKQAMAIFRSLSDRELKIA
jgi:ATP-dependent Lon protease